MMLACFAVFFTVNDSARAESTFGERRYEEMVKSKKKAHTTLRAPTAERIRRPASDPDPRTRRPTLLGMPEELPPLGVPVVVVDLEQQTLAAYHPSGERMKAQSTTGEVVSVVAPISSGRRGFATPTGSYKIAMVDENYVSGKYDASMPFSAFIDHGADGNRLHDGYALHAGNVKYGWASHGCIRVRPDWAEFLFRNVFVPYKHEAVVVIVESLSDLDEELVHAEIRALDAETASN